MGEFQENNINNILNDDSLIGIFEYLSSPERLKIETVCKRWQRLSKSSWRNVKTLSVFSEKEVNNVINVINRSGPYLNYVYISTDIDLCYLTLFKEVSNNCQNIEIFKIFGSYFKVDHLKFWTHENLDAVFKNNQNISSITLHCVKLDCQKLLSLNPNSLTSFSIEYCKFTSEDHLYELFSKLKNLKFISVDDSVNFDKLISALNKSDCENIQDFQIDWFKGCVNGLAKLISKQKKLQSFICFQTESLNELVFDNLPKDSIHLLSIYMNDAISYSLSGFKNLGILVLTIDNLTDRIIRDLTNCDKLESIEFWRINNFSLTKKGIRNFSCFKNIESFTINCFHSNFENFLRGISIFDKMLKAITNYKNLSKLRIENEEYTNVGLESILKHKNLKILSIRNTKKSFKKLINIIIDLPKLEIVKILGPSKLNDYTLKKISDAKIKRGDKRVLKIFLNKLCSNAETIVKKYSNADYPLLSLKLCGYFGE